MCELLFILSAVALSLYAKAVEAPIATICLWFAGLVVIFFIVRIALHNFAKWQLSKRFDEVYSEYEDQFGTTISGREFLLNVEPWHQRLQSHAGMLSMLVDGWTGIALAGLAAMISEVGGKPPEQRALEKIISSIAQETVALEKHLSGHLCLTGIAIALIAIVPRTELFPSTAESIEPTHTPSIAQFPTVDAAKKAAIERYPELSIEGSKLNKNFVTRYKLYQETRPDYFRDNSWPVRLAEELTQTTAAQAPP